MKLFLGALRWFLRYLIVNLQLYGLISKKVTNHIIILIDFQFWNLQIIFINFRTFYLQNLHYIHNDEYFVWMYFYYFYFRVDYLDGNNERWTSLLNFTTIELDKSIPIQDSLQESKLIITLYRYIPMDTSRNIQFVWTTV